MFSKFNGFRTDARVGLFRKADIFVAILNLSNGKGISFWSFFVAPQMKMFEFHLNFWCGGSGVSVHNCHRMAAHE